MATITNLNQLEQLVRNDLDSGDLAHLREVLRSQHPADVADVIDRLDDDQQLVVFRLLVRAQAAEVLGETGSEATHELLIQLPAAEAADLLNQLPMDDVAAILTGDMPREQQALLAAMAPQDAADVRWLLQYPPQSAGRLMTRRFVPLRPATTAAEALDLLRRADPEIETITDLYVVDEGGVLRGVVPLRAVIAAPPDQTAAAMMVTRLVTVTPETDQEQVAQLVSRYDFLALPVVSEQGQMLGIITVDDVIDVLVQEGTEDALRFGAVEGGGAQDGPYFATPIARVVRRRVGWLLLLFVAETATGSVLRFFEGELAKVVALSFFIPLLIGTGGNTGAQTVSTLIRGLALGDVRASDTWRVVVREFGSGLLLGLLLGLFAFGRALLWGTSPGLAAVVGLSIVAICTWANTLGALIPLAAQRFKIDPSLVSAPLITTLVDATGLAIYMLIAKAILGL